VLRSTVVRVLAGSVLAGALALLTIVVGPAAPASAHNTLLSTTPEDGTKLASPPTEVRLVYNAAVSTKYAQVAVSDSAGKLWQQGDPRVSGETVTQPLKPLADGTYTVAWRVISADGHPIDGSYEFQVGEGTPAEPRAERASERGAAGGSQTPWLWPIVGLVAALVVLAAVLGGVVRARESARRRRSAG
jgi:methionine-rich copper-binding protein CopC